MNDYQEKKDCICCGKKNLKTILDLNEQPLANSYHDNTVEQKTYPLKLNLCKNCYHLQLSHIVNPDLLFKDYLYVSGTTKTLRDYFDWFAWYVSMKFETKAFPSVLDIACNDGSQLDSFKQFNWSTFGIDPAENLYPLSSKNHNVVCDYFSADKFDQKFDVIIAQNVFAHNENALQFLNDCDQLMDEDSHLFIQTSQAELIASNQFDTIYHEHLSFFNINSMNELAKRSNLKLIDIMKTSVHGISYVFIFSKKESTLELVKNSLDIEKERGLVSLGTYDTYKENIEKIVSDFKKTIQDFKDKNHKIIGYGAAAKGMTFLNYAKIYPDIIIDDNPLKQGLYTPGGNTLIASIDYIKNLGDGEKVLFVPLAWNFYSEIRERIKKVRDNPNDCFLKYFPNVKTEA